MGGKKRREKKKILEKREKESSSPSGDEDKRENRADNDPTSHPLTFSRQKPAGLIFTRSFLEGSEMKKRNVVVCRVKCAGGGKGGEFHPVATPPNPLFFHPTSWWWLVSGRKAPTLG